MPIVGLTHEKDGRVRLSRSITTKVAIGLPPDTNSNFPKRLDHFVFLRKQMRDKAIAWVPDPDLTKHYGDECREFWIVFLDDDPDQVFRTEVAAYIKRGVWCRGNGESAQRRDLGRDGKAWGEFQKFEGPCANSSKCPVFEKGECKPSGDLYFMLADNPTLGSICRLHTSSYQSIRQIFSALQDLRRITGGRLLGVSAKLFVHPDKNVYEDNRGATVTGTKYVLGLELRASDMAGMQQKLLETARVFAQIKGELGGQVLELEEADEERGPEIAGEFYPETQILPAEQPKADPEEKLEQQAYELLTQGGVSPGRANMTIAKYRGRMQALIDEIRESKGAEVCRVNGSVSPTGQPRSSTTRAADQNSAPSVSSGQQPNSATSPLRSATSGTPAPATRPAANSAQRTSAQTATTAPLTRASENIHGLEVTDEDLPENMRPDSPESSAPAATPSRMPQQAPASQKGKSNVNWSF